MVQTFRHYLRIYLLIEAQYIKARMQYRADFVISAIGMALSNITGIFVFWVLFTTIPALAGWSFNQLLFIYGFYLLRCPRYRYCSTTSGRCVTKYGMARSSNTISGR